MGIGHAVKLPRTDPRVNCSPFGTGKGSSRKSTSLTPSTVTLAWSGGIGLLWIVPPGATGTWIVPMATTIVFSPTFARSLQLSSASCTSICIYSNKIRIYMKLRHRPTDLNLNLHYLSTSGKICILFDWLAAALKDCWGKRLFLLAHCLLKQKCKFRFHFLL